MSYLLKRIPDGAYVARPGSARSYTRSLKQARVFRRREDAEGDRCVENEYIVEVADELRGLDPRGLFRHSAVPAAEHKNRRHRC